MYPYANYNVYNYPNPSVYQSRNPYFIPRPYFDEFTGYDYRQYSGNEKMGPYLQDYEEKNGTYERLLYFLRLLAFAQIFGGGVLLVTDVSKIVLLWNYFSVNDTKLEYISQLLYPIYIIVLGFTCLTAAVNPSNGISKFVLVMIVTTVVPCIILPKSAVFVRSAMEAMELSRVASRSVYSSVNSHDISMEMIQSETANKLVKMLAMRSERNPLGIQDVSLISSDYLLTVQYLLISYAMFSFLHLLLLILTLILLLRLVNLQ